MGVLTYHNGTTTAIDDRALAHLQIVIGAKLARSESFFFTWTQEAVTRSGRTSVWIHPGAGLIYRYDDDDRAHDINAAWLEALELSANSRAGLHLVREPSRDPHVEYPRSRGGCVRSSGRAVGF
ncbi:ATP-dependent DNA ligase [Microbacterium sp. P06]|uniref:DUF7882 family protein n=1 Tax=unclassified Microbacterium TaxID=2609290 RepID=UPI0037469057